MKKLIWATTLIILFAVFVFPAVLALGIRYLPANIQPSLEGTKDVYRTFTVSQEFTSLESRLTGIGMSIKNPNLKNKKDITLNLYNTKGDLLRTAILNGSVIEDGSFVKFMFDPIQDSKNQIYTFVLSCPSAGPEEVLPIFYTVNKPSWMGKMMYTETEVIGGVSMVMFNKPESKLIVIKEIYTNWFSRLLPLNSQKSK